MLVRQTPCPLIAVDGLTAARGPVPHPTGDEDRQLRFEGASHDHNSRVPTDRTRNRTARREEGLDCPRRCLAVVMTGLVVLNLLIAARTESNFIWFPFPLVGWGIGRTMHYLHGVRWADREIRARQARIEGMASSPGERRP